MPVIVRCCLPILLSTLLACDSLDGGTDVAGLIASQFATVTVDPEDVAGGQLVSDTAVNPETFLSSLRSQMQTIASVDLTRIALVPATTGVIGVDAWSDLYQGELLVQLVPTSGTPLTVGKMQVPAAGLGAMNPVVTTDRATLDTVPDIAAGRFSVRLTAATPRVSDDAFALTVKVELEFVAF